MAVDTSDSNGQCVEFCWGLDKDGINETNSTPFYTTDLQKNVLRELKVWCKDDDSIKSEPLYCWVYPDAPPDTPVVTSDAIVGGRKISWTGKDFKDGNATQYKIIVKKGGSPDEAADIVQDFQPGTNYDDGAPLKDFSYSYTPSGGTGTYYYRVIAKDARGSKAPSTVNNFDFIE
jgi:hypothetical protein